MAKDNIQKIKSTFEDWRENAGREMFISPFGKMYMQMKHRVDIPQFGVRAYL